MEESMIESLREEETDRHTETDLDRHTCRQTETDLDRHTLTDRLTYSTYRHRQI